MITVTRRAGCLIPTRRVIRCQEKLEKWGRQQIDTLKDLKSKINVGSCIQILIWFHFRIELDVKHMPAGRNISSIDFIGVETPDKDRSSEFKKSEKVKQNWKFDRVIFLGLAAQKSFVYLFERKFKKLKWFVEQDVSS